MRRESVLPLLLLGLALSQASTGQSAELPSASEGKFHLVYRVIAPKIEIGAEVEVEPALITDGDQIVFAYDYCRHHYPAQNYRPGRRAHEERVEPMQVAREDQIDLQHYCQRQPFRLAEKQLTAVDNTGARLTLGKVNYAPLTLDVNQQWAPEPFTATIIATDGRVAEKLPAAKEEKQPYVFLMSRNRELLNRVVPVAIPGEAQKAALLTRLEQYKARRQATDPTAAKEECETYVPNYRDTWGVVPKTPPAIAELTYLDIDGDGQVDLLARPVEDRTRQAMMRLYHSDATDQCLLRNRDPNRRSAIYRPIMVIKTPACVYAFTQLDTLEYAPNQALVRLNGSASTCHFHETYRWYERH